MKSDTPPGTALRVGTLIVGAGFGGLCLAIKLRARGDDDFLILEKADEIGGTWRDNHYPGAACDVQSHLYSFSFAPKSDWSQRYAGWEEIQAYLLAVCARYGIRPFIRFGRTVNAAVFDEAAGEWLIGTTDGEQIRANRWVLATGPLHHPSIPDIPGLSTFAGKLMHSARWDAGHDLTGLRVASVGSGGSAIQYVPEIATRAGQVDVYQRTAAWVLPRDERRYSAWRKRLFARLPALRTLHRWRLYWSNEARVWPLFAPRIARALQRLLAWHMRRQVRDAQTARALTPDYTLGCKRILISNKWLAAFNRPNVSLISAPISEIRAHGIVTADGVERPADCLILGTGFVVDPRRYLRDFTLQGRTGHRIDADWAKVPNAYLGVCVAGYPNLFQLVGPNTALGHNSVVFMIEAQVHYILQCLDETRRRGARWLDVKAAAQADFNARIQAKLHGTVWDSGCTSWYQTAEGVNFTLWPGSTWRYWLACRRVRCADYEFGGG